MKALHLPHLTQAEPTVICNYYHDTNILIQFYNEGTFLKNGFFDFPLCVPWEETVVPDTDLGKDLLVGLAGLCSSS